MRERENQTFVKLVVFSFLTVKLWPLLTGNFVTTTYNLSGGYMPSFQKKEVGSVGQRIQLAPLGHQHARKSSVLQFNI